MDIKKNDNYKCETTGETYEITSAGRKYIKCNVRCNGHKYERVFITSDFESFVNKNILILMK